MTCFKVLPVGVGVGRKVKNGRLKQPCLQDIEGLKGQSNEIFDPQFLSSFEPAWAFDQWVKIFSFLVSFSPRYSSFSEVPRSIILRRVKFCVVSYCAESSSAQYHTARGHFTFPYPRDSQTRFATCSLHNSILPWPLSNGLKYFRFL